MGFPGADSPTISFFHLGAKSSDNCGGEVISIQSVSVDAEKNEIGGESAPGNPMLTTPSHSQSRGQPSKSRGAKEMSSQVQKTGKVTQPKTTSVLSDEMSRVGTLASALRRKMESLTPMLGFKFRVVEAAGTSLADMLSNKNLWQGSACGRKHCHPCQQKSERREE